MKIDKFFGLFKFKGLISIVYYIAFLALLWYLIIPHTSIYYMNNLFTPISKRLNEDDVTLIKGEEFKLYVYKLNQRLYFSSTDIKVADVNIFGNVTAYRVGTTIIRVKYNDEILKCRVRVIDINKHKINLKVGNKSNLDIEGAIFGVRWSSSNNAIAQINRLGIVTAKSKGNATIYAKVRGKILTCEVNVE